MVSSCNYHIWSLRHIRHLVDRDTANTIACSVVATRLDYCNAVLHGVTVKNISRLQRVQNSLARVVCAAPYHSPSDPLLRCLHWLPVKHRITYKVATLTFKALLHRQPHFLFQLLNTYILPNSSAAIIGCWFAGGRKLPSKQLTGHSPLQRQQSGTARRATTTPQFTRLLKTHLFTLGWSRTVPPAPLTHYLLMNYGAVIQIDDWLIDWISDIRALWRSALSARVPDVRNLKCKLDLDGTEHFEM